MTEGWCDFCKIMVPCITGLDAENVPTQEAMGETRSLLGNPSTSPKQIWNRIRDCEGSEGDWIWNRPSSEQAWISGPPPHWDLRNEDFDLLSNKDEAAGSLEQLRRLQRGGILPDGSYLSWSEGTFYLDGLSIEIPFLGLMKILRMDRKASENVNWKVLLLSISLAVTRFKESRRMGPLSDKFSVTHPVHLMLFEPSHRSPWERLMRRSRSSSGVVNTPREEFRDTTWMKSWDAWLGENRDLARSIRGDRVTVPVSLFISRNGRLQLRVRRDHGWRKLEVGSHPEIWSKVVTWVLSPPSHPLRKRLECVQQGIFADPESTIIPSEEMRGICLLKSVVDSSDRAEADIDLKTIRVEGTSGLRYLVVPGHGGAHGTRFTVFSGGNGMESSRIRDLERVRGRSHEPPICIVEKPELRRLVIGDAVASVVMALLDDMASSKGIDTLRNHISSNARSREQEENPALARVAREMNEARWYRDRLMRNAVADRVRRYTESFPVLWGAMLRIPLGERVTFRAMRRGQPNVSFDGCDTEFTSRNMTERRAIYCMLENSGWIRDREEERLRGEQRIYIRTGTGDRELGGGVEQICEILEPELVLGERVELVHRQLWTYFERVNPGPSALLPGSDQHID